jgi:hypothetical protein
MRPTPFTPGQTNRRKLMENVTLGSLTRDVLADYPAAMTEDALATAAKTLYRAITDSPESGEIFLSLVMTHLRSRRRLVVNTQEKIDREWEDYDAEVLYQEELPPPSLFDKPGKLVRTSVKEPAAPRTQQFSYLTKEIDCGPYGRVVWGEATIDQLKARQQMLRTQRIALDNDINYIGKKIDLIAETPGATCLNDVLRIKGSVSY